MFTAIMFTISTVGFLACGQFFTAALMSSAACVAWGNVGERAGRRK